MNLSTVLGKMGALQLDAMTALKNVADESKTDVVILEWLGTPEGKLAFVPAARAAMFSLTSAHQAFVAAASRLLRPVVSIDFPGNDQPFVVRDHFVINTADDAPVKISGLWGDFKSLFLDQIVPAGPRYQIVLSELTRNSLDGPIMTGLKQSFENFEMDFAAVYHLMRLQRNREDGVLLTDGHANIFYIPDVKGRRRAVDMSWVGGGWIMLAFAVDYLGPWHQGRRVGSRNS